MSDEEQEFWGDFVETMKARHYRYAVIDRAFRDAAAAGSTWHLVDAPSWFFGSHEYWYSDVLTVWPEQRVVRFGRREYRWQWLKRNGMNPIFRHVFRDGGQNLRFVGHWDFCSFCNELGALSDRVYGIPEIYSDFDTGQVYRGYPIVGGSGRQIDTVSHKISNDDYWQQLVALWESAARRPSPVVSDHGTECSDRVFPVFNYEEESRRSMEKILREQTERDRRQDRHQTRDRATARAEHSAGDRLTPTDRRLLQSLKLKQALCK